jgi:hypothetical protein
LCFLLEHFTEVDLVFWLGEAAGDIDRQCGAALFSTAGDRDLETIVQGLVHQISRAASGRAQVRAIQDEIVVLRDAICYVQIGRE